MKRPCDVDNSAVAQDHSNFHRSLRLCLYLVPFLRYSTPNSGMSLKFRSGITEGHWKWHIPGRSATTSYLSSIVSIIIIFNIIKNECHSNIIVDRLQVCGHSKKLRESESESRSSKVV